MMRRQISAAAVTAAAVTILVGAATWTTRADQSASAARTITAADYARAEKALGAATTPLVFGLTLQPTWLPDGRMWYRVGKIDGTSDTILVDPTGKTRTVCSPSVPACAGLDAGAAPGRGGRAGGQGR